MSALLIDVPIIMAAIAMALVAYGANPVTSAVLLTIWGLVATATPVAWFTWIAQTMPDDVEAGGGLFVAICQLAIALGGTVGGILFDAIGYRATFETSALLLLLTAVLAYLAGRSASAAEDAGSYAAEAGGRWPSGTATASPLLPSVECDTQS
ncbi:MFS transporter [Cupriavidus plantarum]|uniref:hypothetical protein n=2 Tax=Cupriavidus plantarum TaxID=942865 RepID=UPI00339D776C